MLRKVPPLYWTPLMRCIPYVTYVQSQVWYRDARLQSLLRERVASLADLVSADTVGSILSQHSQGVDRTRSLAFLLTMVHWKSVVSPSS